MFKAKMDEVGKYDTVRLMECELDGVHHVVYKCPPIVRHITGVAAGKRDGRVFPYVAHYLGTGDMLYPMHEGDAMVNRLLDELTQLDLVHDLLHARTPAMPSLSSCLPTNNSHSINGGRRFTVGGDGNTLKVHTKRRRRLSFSGLLTHLLPAHTLSSGHNASSVYRPPSNKGTTLVLVQTSQRRCTQLTVNGPANSLKRLFPGNPVQTTHATYPLLDSRTVPVSPSASALLATLQDQGYHPTVKSSWVERDSGALITQWIVYHRRGGPKPLSVTPPHLHYSTSSINLSTSSSSSAEDDEFSNRRGTLPNLLRSKSKSIFSLATDHTTTYRPTLTLKRILSVLL
ncbi:uncharacterized protein [Macrobrachium rosenbergii]|uniref:uncharacterized protein n=1 Tax=Macrobrachium rosenbergii TaxID=79674 RepID=UPI0034D70A58